MTSGPPYPVPGAQPAPPALREIKATIALAAVITVIFVLEVVSAHGAISSIPAVVLGRMGGNVADTTRTGQELWRWVTAGYLHGGLIHYGMNTFSLVTIGSAIERRFGWGWVVGGFVTSVIVGSVVSTFGHKTNIVGIGASGGIFGLIAMAAVLAFLVPRLAPFRRDVLVRWILFGLVLGFAGGFDNWGHAGGIVGGAVCALIIVVTKRPTVFMPIGLALGVAGVVVSGASIVLAARASLHPGAAYDERFLDASNRLNKAIEDKDDAAAQRAGEEIFALRPDEPIGQYYRARSQTMGGHCDDRALSLLRGLLVVSKDDADGRGQWFVEHNRARVLLAISNCLTTAGDPAEADAAFKRFCDEAPNALDHESVEIYRREQCELGYGPPFQRALHEIAKAIGARDENEASRLGREISARYPFDPQAQYFAGKAEEMAGRCDAAVPHYQRALAAPDPKASAAGKRFWEQGRSAAAGDLYRCHVLLGDSAGAEAARSLFCDLEQKADPETEASYHGLDTEICDR